MDKKGKLLVVEDDKDTLAALCAMLDHMGYDVLPFSDSSEVIDKIQHEKLDLALLDIMMPKMNGYELLQEIKKIQQFADLPIIMVTAKDQNSEVLEGYQHGADYYITKPFTSKQLEYGIRLFLP